MAFLTVFSAPKPFTNPHIDTIQRNAIQSWQHLGPEVETLLVGQEDGMAEAAADYGVPLLAEVKRNEAGTPLVSSIFDLARRASSSPYLAYVNGDILLLPDIVQATRQIAAGVADSNGSGADPSSPFLLIGQRWDLQVEHLLDFSDGWEARLRGLVSAQGQLHTPAGSDYFVFPRQAFSEMPDFAIGRAGWDNWMIFYALQQRWPVIDGTPSLMVIHQSHDYSHLPGGRPHYDLAESQHNQQIGGGLKHMYMVLDADCQLIEGQIKPARFTWLRLIRQIERNLMPENGELRGLRGALTRRLRKLRKRFGSEA